MSEDFKTPIQKIVQRVEMDITRTQIHDHFISFGHAFK